MKKRITKILCLILAVMLTLTGFTGCKKKHTAEGRDVYQGGDGMFDNKLTIFRWNFSGLNSARKKNSPVYKLLKEKAGMHLYASTAGGSDWKTKLNVMFNTQMLPDIFVSMGPENPKQYSDMIDDGVLIPVSDFVSETKYPNINNHLKKFDYLKTNLSYAKGKHWSIPVDWTLEHTMYIRLDWLENLNKPDKLRKIIADEQGKAEAEVTAEEMELYKFAEPKNLLEFYRVCRAFTLYDPDENGKNDTYGYTSAGGDDLFADSWMFIAFDAGYKSMKDYSGDGNYTSSYTNEGTEKAIAYFNDLYKAGYIDPSWYENSTDDKQQAFTKGKVGMMEGHAWFNTIVRGYIAANTTANYKPSIEEASSIIGMFDPPAGEKGTYGISGNPNFWTVTCLNNGMSNDELTAALSLIDYMLSDEGKELLIYGIEGQHFDYVDGKRVSKMGKAADGFNRTLSEVDPCFEISSVTNWSTGYLEPYQTNADKINAVMERAPKYVTYPDYPFLSTKAYVDHWDILCDFAETEVFNMICSSNNYVERKIFEDGRKIPLLYSEIGIPSANLKTTFANFVKKYNNQGGSQINKEYNTAKTNATKVSLLTH